jgi:hypothetical protein
MDAHCTKGLCYVISSVSILYFNQPNPSITLLTLSPTSYYSMAFSVFSCAFFHTDVMYFNIIHSLPFSFPLSSPLVSSNSSTIVNMFYTYKQRYRYIYTTVSVFVHTFIFRIYLPHMKENMQPLSF